MVFSCDLVRSIRGVLVTQTTGKETKKSELNKHTNTSGIKWKPRNGYDNINNIFRLLLDIRTHAHNHFAMLSGEHENPFSPPAVAILRPERKFIVSRISVATVSSFLCGGTEITLPAENA